MFIETFAREMKEMNHIDLEIIGIKAFGTRHDILKATNDFNPINNLVKILSAASENTTFLCKHCNITMRSFNMLQNHYCCVKTSNHLVDTFVESTNNDADKSDSINFQLFIIPFEKVCQHKLPCSTNCQFIGYRIDNL